MVYTWGMVLEHTLTQTHGSSGAYSALKMAQVLHIPVSQMAQILGVSRQALHKNPESSRLQPQMQRLDRLLVRLTDLTGSLEHTRIWLKAGHPDFAGKPPLEYLYQGAFEPLEDLIEALETGLPG